MDGAAGLPVNDAAPVAEPVSRALTVQTRPRVISSEGAETFVLPEGDSIADILARANWHSAMWAYTAVSLNGHVIPRDRWARVRPRAGSQLVVAVVPQGGSGKQMLSIVASIAIMAFAWWAGGALAGVLGWGNLGRSMLVAGIAMVANLGLSALIRPKVPRMDLGSATAITDSGERTTEPTYYSLGGQRNQAKPYAPMPRLLGSARMAPNLVAEPYVQTIGRDSYLFAVYDFGYGPIQLADIRVGDTPIGYLHDVDIRIHTMYKSGDSLQLYHGDLHNTQVGATLSRTYQYFRSDENTPSVAVEFHFPSGLFTVDRRGGLLAHQIDIELLWRYVGQTDVEWKTIDQISDRWFSWDNTTTFNNSVSLSGGTVRQRFEAWAPPAVSLWPGVDADKIIFIYGDETIAGWLKPGWFIVFPGNRAVEIVGIMEWLPDATDGSRGQDVNIIRAHYIVETTSRGLAGIITEELEIVGIVEPYTGPPGQITVRAATRQPLTVQLWLNGFWPNSGIEFAYRRSSDESTSTDIADRVILTNVISRFFRQPFYPTQPHTVMEVRIKANEQLSGALDTVTAHCTSWHSEPHGNNNGGWIWTASRNPAAHYLEVLRGTANPRPVPDEMIDFPAFERWGDYCNKISPHGDVYYTNDILVDGRVTIGELLTDIARAGRAVPTIRDGKYSILMEDEARSPVQMFTVKNTRSMQFERIWRRQPHALRMRYISEMTNLVEELTVYDDGYDGWNATEYETVSEIPGMTRWWQVWRYGRRLLAEGKLRRETWTINTDIEGLVCQRGDLILVASDSLRAGGEAMRIARVSGDDVWFDEYIEALSGADSMRVRRNDGSYLLVAIVASPEPGAVRVPAGQGAFITAGMLAVIGSGTSITHSLIVTRITPGTDLSVAIEAVEQAPGIAMAETSTIPDYAPPNWVPARRQSTEAPRAFAVAAIYSYDENGNPLVTLFAQWLPPPRVSVGYYVLYEIVGDTWIPLATTTLTSHEFSYSRLNVPREGTERHFAVVAMSKIGTVSLPARTSLIVTRDNQAPGPVASFSINILTETILLMWEPPPNTPDLARFELRFASREGVVDTLGNDIGDWNKMTLLAESIPANTRQFSTAARPGLYAISAIDSSGNYGPPVFNRTYIDEMPNVDIVIVLAAGGGPLDAPDLYLSPAKYVDPDRLGGHATAPGNAVPLTVGKLVDLDFVAPPVINRQGYLTAAKITDDDVPRIPTVTRAAGAGQLQLGKIVDSDVLRVHLVQDAAAAGGAILLEDATGALLRESDADPGRVLQELLAEPGPGPQAVGGAKEIDADTLRPPSLANLSAGTLAVGKRVDPDTLRGPTLIPGPRSATAPKISDADTLRAPTVSAGAQVGGYYILTENGIDWVALEDGTGRIVQESGDLPLSLPPAPSRAVQLSARAARGRRATPAHVPARQMVVPLGNPADGRRRAAPALAPLGRLRTITAPLREGEVLPGPGWSGDYENTERLSAELRLTRDPDGTYRREGWFFSATEFETATPTRLRLSSSVDAYGYAAGRTIGGWVPLASAVPLDDTQRGRDWDAEIYIRALRNPELLGSAWFAPLANAVPLVGDVAAQSPWTRLVAGDWETTLVQWAIRLWSREPNITPSVRWAEVRVDVVERRESGSDVDVPNTGLRVPFGAGFWEPPVLSLTLANVPEGTKIVRTVDRNGFDIQLVNGGVGVSGVIDWIAIGYGKTS